MDNKNYFIVYHSYASLCINNTFLCEKILSIFCILQVSGLDLSENKLHSLDVFRNLNEKLPKLQMLSLKNNEVIMDVFHNGCQVSWKLIYPDSFSYSLVCFLFIYL